MHATVLNLFGMALAGVQPARSHPPAMRPSGAVPSLLPKRTELTYNDLAGVEIAGDVFQGLCNSVPQRRKGILKAIKLGLAVSALVLLTRSCEPQIDFGVECRQVTTEVHHA